MIIGVGLDIVSLSRIEEAMVNPRFVRRVLTAREQTICKGSEQVAGRWAAKEAVAKALNCRLGWHDVEVLADEAGKPVVSLANAELAHKVQIWLSITHEKGLAAAVAIAEQKG